jgi:4,5-dihydroxyphthalate decarboxylase
MNSANNPEIIIRGGDHEHVVGIAGDHANGVRLGYEAMRLQDIFVAMLEKRQFEICEFSLANYIVLRANGQHWLSAIPVFPFRAFRHSTALTCRDSALTDLAQLAGKRVGVEDYSMTAAVWFRGLLKQEYGVDHRSVKWVSYAKQRLPLPRGASVEFTDRDLEDLLCDGGIDAMLGFAARDSRLPPPQRRLRTLLPDPQVVEEDYYRRTSIYPINHCVVIRNDALDRNPALAGAVYNAYASAKQRAYRRQLGATLVPWGRVHWERTFGLFDGDPLPYGLTPQNRLVVAQLVQDLHEQGFIANVPALEELFIIPQDTAA